VRVAFADGTEGHYELVVGADGIRSTVRRMCFGPSTLRYVGQMYWRAAVDAELVDVPTMMFADGRYVVVFPLGGGVTYVAWQLHCAKPFQDDVDGRRLRLRERFADFLGPAPAALASLRDDASAHFGWAEELDTEQWYSGRVVLLGDAAHACSPTMAQGGSPAIEDGVVLAEALDVAGDVGSALDQYVARRSPRVGWVRERTHVEIEMLNRGATHLSERARETKAMLASEV
jgi:2-polyprenyl-6-methoxyphenol hydroxylase-like FAD-dependent oxidoreductase